jgi:hypothetical protein
MSTLSTTNLKNPSAGSNNIVLGTDGSTRVTTLADSAGANTSTPAEIASGRAKAWVNFNGTGTVAIRASYNVRSITDNGVGSYTVNFDTALTDTNYAVVASAGGFATFEGFLSPYTYTTSSVLLRSSGGISNAGLNYVGANGNIDHPNCNVAIFR